MWTAPGEIVVDRERHSSITEVYAGGRVESDRVPRSESPPEGAQIQCTILYKGHLRAISNWRRQAGGTRPNKLWVHSDNAPPHTAKMSRAYIGLI
jgi:hypothetical protein